MGHKAPWAGDQGIEGERERVGKGESERAGERGEGRGGKREVAGSSPAMPLRCSVG